MRLNGYYKCKEDFDNGLGVIYFKKGDTVYLEFPPTAYKDWKSSDGVKVAYGEFYVKEHNGKEPLFKTGYHLTYFKGCFKKKKKKTIDRFDRLEQLLREGEDEIS